MNKEIKNIESINKGKIKVGEMIVEIEYSENGKTFYECILNILKQRME